MLPAGRAIVGADSRGLRYGDGLFETIKVRHGRVMLAGHHFERLYAGLSLLNFTVPADLDADRLYTYIIMLCRKNGVAGSARVRMMFFRGDGGLHDPGEQAASWIIQSTSWKDEDWPLNEEGLRIGVFAGGQKSCDGYSNLKSNNYLLYSMGGQHARRQGWDDALILNSHERIADSTIANLWYCKDGVIYTPPLSEGCVAGVMRRWMLERLPEAGFRVEERAIIARDLEDADEIFFSNALRGVQWVGAFGDRIYGNDLAQRLHRVIYQPLLIF